MGDEKKMSPQIISERYAIFTSWITKTSRRPNFVILMLGLGLGISIASGFGGFVLILVIASAFGVVWSGISLYIALKTKNSESTLMISLLTTFPLLFLSTAVMPMAFLPNWVQTVA